MFISKTDKEYLDKIFEKLKNSTNDEDSINLLKNSFKMSYLLFVGN